MCKVLGCVHVLYEAGYCKAHWIDIKRAKLANERSELKAKGYSDTAIERLKPLRFGDDLLADDEDDEGVLDDD